MDPENPCPDPGVPLLAIKFHFGEFGHGSKVE